MGGGAVAAAGFLFALLIFRKSFVCRRISPCLTHTPSGKEHTAWSQSCPRHLSNSLSLGLHP
jgi:hypothetical protein